MYLFLTLNRFTIHWSFVSNPRLSLRLVLVISNVHFPYHGQQVYKTWKIYSLHIIFKLALFVFVSHLGNHWYTRGALRMSPLPSTYCPPPSGIVALQICCIELPIRDVFSTIYIYIYALCSTPYPEFLQRKKLTTVCFRPAEIWMLTAL